MSSYSYLGSYSGYSDRLSSSERGGVQLVNRRIPLARSLSTMIHRRRNTLLKMLLVFILLTVVAGVYVMRTDQEHSGTDHIKDIARTVSTVESPSEEEEKNAERDDNKVMDGRHFVPAVPSDKEDTPPTNEPTNENKVLNVQHVTNKTMSKGQPLQLTHNEQQEAIVKAFKHAWKAYRNFAWGKDELKPISHTSSTWFNLGLTLVDALDTMWLMGLKDEFDEARNWVAHEMIIAQNRDVNLFETTIRVLGGLLSTYHLTKDNLFLERASDLGDRLLHAFSSSSSIPYSDVNLYSLKAHAPKWGPDSSVSEVTSIQLEFRDLTQLTGNKEYQKIADRALDKVQEQYRRNNLIPQFINAQTGRLSGGTLTMGARADSYYEYLFKLWIQSGKGDDKYRQWYMECLEGIKEVLLGHSEPNRLTFIGEMRGSRFSPKMDHLVCFFPGVLGLASQSMNDPSQLELAKELLYTCWQMYERMPTGLSAEIVYFNTDSSGKDDIIVKPNDRHNLLRPETLESLFIMYRLTKDPKYREWGWKIFQSFEKYTKLSDGYSSIKNVESSDNPGYRDKMESFFLGETLKYLFLLFTDDDSVLPLDKWVFNTEAHPLPILTR